MCPLTLHCEFKLGRINVLNCSLHTFIIWLFYFIFHMIIFSYMRLRIPFLFYWFILCTRGYIESKKNWYQMDNPHSNHKMGKSTFLWRINSFRTSYITFRKSFLCWFLNNVTLNPFVKKHYSISFSSKSTTV